MIRRREINLYKGEFLDILNLLFSKKYSSKNYIKEFEEAFSDYIGTRHAIATHTGRDSLLLLLDALKLKKGDEIIFPAYTLKDLILLVKEKGFKPVLIDIEEDSLNINSDLIEKKINKKTKAIIATHMFGLPCNIKKILKIAKKYNIHVIEDCCLAHGAEFEGRKVGSFGTAGFFSFHQIKLLSTFGGGMITTNNNKIAENIRKKIRNRPSGNRDIPKKILLVYLEDFIMKSLLFYLFSALFYFKLTKKLFKKFYLSFSRFTRGKASKYTDIQAFVGIKQLSTLNKRIDKRRKNAKLLSRLIHKNLKIQRNVVDCKHSYYYFIIILNYDSEKTQRKLLSKGLDIGIKNEITDDCTKVFKKFSKECPITNRIFNSSIQIPIYESLTEENIHTIANILNEETIK